jgi:putative alpha-1,2-mannosidase
MHGRPTRPNSGQALTVLLGVAALAGAGLPGAVPAGLSRVAPVEARMPRLVDPASVVDPLIGTSGAGDVFPGADVPFGMVQWSPDTPTRPYGGGYEHNDKTLTGFSLTHVSGPGCGAAGDVPVLPTTGPIVGSPNDVQLPLDHASEQAAAGTYRITANGITTALTATPRSGMARFSFPPVTESNLLFKLSDSANGVTSTHFQVVSSTEVAGWVTSGHFCGAADEYNVYFNMSFDTPFTSYGTYDKGVELHPGAASQSLNLVPVPGLRSQKHGAAHRKPGSRVARPRSHSPATSAPSGASVSPRSGALQPPVSGAAGAYLTFDTSTTPIVQAKVGVSYVSTANAKANRMAENPGWDFEEVSTAAHALWNQMLSKIEIGGGTESERKVFETALYHALLHPNVYSDVNGQYLGFDGQVHTTPPGHVEFANISGWDIYRSQVQLAALVAPVQTSDLVRSMLDQYEQTGQLPKWELNNGETYVMVGDPAAVIIADAYAFGARDFDTGHALKAMLLQANRPNNVRPGLEDYLSKGYLPLDGAYECCNLYGQVSTQLEYNTADYAISAFARALGDTATADVFARRANNWQNVFNPVTGHLQAKNADGSFAPDFTPGTYAGFVEATSAQYTPMVPFDVAGIVAANGGNDAWVARLDGLTAQVKNSSPLTADFGNEPSIGIPWEYDYVGAPYKTQSVVRRIQQELFTTAPNGIPGNDDLGTMSAWYVFSALGFYPHTPGTPILALGSAVFPQAILHLPSGKTLTITAPNASAANPYVSSMTVNGLPWTHAYLPSGLITDGGAVDEVLSPTANPGFGSVTATDAPPSDTAGLASALGFTTSSRVAIEPGNLGALVLGARNLQGQEQEVSWSISSPDGLTVTPSSGTLLLGAYGSGTRSVSVKTPVTEGRHLLTITYRSSTGATLPTVTTQVDVAEPGALWPFFNNAGIGSDGTRGPADFDGYGWAYSAQQLAAAGVAPGKTLTVNGFAFRLPDTEPGDLDNIRATGQTIPIRAASVSKIGFLGSSSGAPPGVSVKATVHFSDDSAQTITLALSDWTLAGGAASGPSFGNTIAVTTNHRDASDGTAETAKTYLFEADATLTGHRSVTSVTLPAPANGGQLHVFAIATA